MKKFISMVMAAAMVVSLVPATAFAASGDAKFSVAGAQEWSEKTVPADPANAELDGTQIQLEVTDVNGKVGVPDSYEIALDFDGAEFGWDYRVGSTFDWETATEGTAGVIVTRTNHTGVISPVDVASVTVKGFEEGDTYLELKITEAEDLRVGDIITVQLNDTFIMSSKSEGSVATVTVYGDFGTSEAMTVGSVLAEGIDLTVAGKPAEVPVETKADLKMIEIESVVGTFQSGDEITLKISKGFEFSNVPAVAAVDGDGDATGSATASWGDDDDELKIAITGTPKKLVIAPKALQIEAIDAEAGDIATLTAKCKDYEGDSDEAAVVIADTVVMSVDEDADVPEMYAGVDVDDFGLTSGINNHKSLKVKIEESVKDVWSDDDAFTLTLPEGVYVQDVVIKSNDGVVASKGLDIDNSNSVDVREAFMKAYVDGDYEAFEFSRRAFVVSDTDNTKAKIEFELVLVADPSFTGDVTLAIEGEDFESNEVVIAKFVAPWTVEAAQNDLVIDYKETVVPTEVTITEAEEGLWEKTAGENKFVFGIEDDRIDVESVDVDVNEESDMEIKEATVGTSEAGFVVKELSDDEVAVVTVSNMELYMNRSIPAGSYDLTLTTDGTAAYMGSQLFGQAFVGDGDETVADVSDWDGTVKEAFVNVITAGRDQDDASFTKKVVVPVGATEIVAGEDVVALDVPAYINAAGYTMLPVRAVSVALGINTNNVIWDQATKTVTILYGQRIITMTVGQKVINVNGSAIPASAAVEIVNGRTFLGLRDLATALGVVDITWDAATQTATLNGNK